VTDAELDAIEERANGASPGPLMAEPSDDGSWLVTHPGNRAVVVAANLRQGDAELLARAPADLRALVSALREARRVLRECEWAGDAGDTATPVCPICEAGKAFEPHAPGCALAEAIR
jgi:hypothetical protein